LIVKRAPARLDVMGGIADYSGSLVLELPLREATRVSIEREESRTLSLASERPGGEISKLTIPLDELPRSYEEARTYFRADASRSWAAYVAGALVVLTREKGVVFRGGARIGIQSTIPEGKGVASSAAVEVATMMAIDAAYELGLDPNEVAFLSQRVENAVVGAPCGVMDQMTAVFGEENRLLALLCQPAEIRGNLEIPSELSFWGIDSGISHQVSGADYASVRVGAFMGYRMLKDWAGTDWGGYLANIAPAELEENYLDRLPETILGRDFLERYRTTGDAATTVEPGRVYPVRRPTAHPVYEHARVQAFARLLETGGAASAPALGNLMYESHASYSACGLGSEGTDQLVELARALGPSRGIFGAKITGGGSGGTVGILGRRDAGPAIREIVDRYAEETGRRPYVFSGSSPGALNESTRPPSSVPGWAR
jgi:L-arabinokinase